MGVPNIEEIAEADYQAALRYYKEKKEKTPEPKISFVETGKIELNIRIPHLYSGALIHIVRDMRRTLENCANLNLLDEFIETQIVEYEKVPIKEAN